VIFSERDVSGIDGLFINGTNPEDEWGSKGEAMPIWPHQS